MAQATRRLTPLRQRAQYKLQAAVADFHSGELLAARSKLEEALDLDHELTEARLWLAHMLLTQGRPDAAVEQYETGLLFSPHDERLQQGLQTARAAAANAATPAGRDKAAAKQRLVPNLILSALIPPSGILLGLWEIVTARTEEWRELGLKTLLAGIAALFAWVILLSFISVIVEGGVEPAAIGP